MLHKGGNAADVQANSLTAKRNYGKNGEHRDTADQTYESSRYYHHWQKKGGDAISPESDTLTRNL